MFDRAVDEGMVPLLSNAIFQSTLASLTCAILVGSIGERARIIPASIFVFVWTTLVYDPIACWTWNSSGWANKLGALDYAGGTTVHVSAGFAALGYCFMIGKRRAPEVDYRPYSIHFVVVGTFLMWVGWFGFNSGTSLVPTPRAVQALLTTQLAASMGGFAWALLDYRIAKKWSVVGFCSGVIAGLVAITPGAGLVSGWSALIYGILAGLIANFATKIKFSLNIDDGLDVFAVHGVGGIVGNVLTGIFANKNIAALDGVTDIPGGWINRHYIQICYQIAGTIAAAAYSFVVTVLILYIINKIPGLHLRMSTEDEELGIDFAEHDEVAFDYIELFPELPTSRSQVWDEFGEHQVHMDEQNEDFLGGLDHSHDGNIEASDDRKDGLARDQFEAHSPANSFQDMLMFPSGFKQESSPSQSIDEYEPSIEPAHAIEGSSTYRRIQDQLEVTKWNQLHRGALLDRRFSSSTVSHLSPTASPRINPIRTKTSSKGTTQSFPLN